jgi:hypothetical protein
VTSPHPAGREACCRQTDEEELEPHMNPTITDARRERSNTMVIERAPGQTSDPDWDAPATPA